MQLQNVITQFIIQFLCVLLVFRYMNIIKGSLTPEHSTTPDISSGTVGMLEGGKLIGSVESEFQSCHLNPGMLYDLALLVVVGLVTAFGWVL